MIGVGRDGPVGPAASTFDTERHARPGPERFDGSPGIDPVVPDRAAPRAGAGCDSTRGKSAGRRGSAAADEIRAAWAVLASVDGLGPAGLVALVEHHGDARAALASAAGPGGEDSLIEVLGRRGGRALAQRIVAAAGDRAAILAAIRAAGLAVVTLDDTDYPGRLRGIELPPPVLFVRGSVAALSAAHATAVVGTRRPTDAGRATAARLAGTLARVGSVVVSGLAVGIDGVAHAATVGVGGRTVAVIGGGHGRAIPRRHRRLAEEIVAGGGAVVSEHAPETHASRGTFPRRNRVISGLTEATIVVEAGVRSGALITAGWALEQGRGCFVVPGPIDAPMSAGCLGLLREYPGEARVVASAGALLEDLGLVDRRPGPAAASDPAGPGPRATIAGPEAILADLPPTVAGVARSLAAGARTADHVVAATGLTVPGALAALTILEDGGLVVAAYGRYRLAGALSDLGR